jgi:hypothetical protein
MYHTYSKNTTNADTVTARGDGRLTPRRLCSCAPAFVAVLVAFTSARPATSQDDPISVANAPSRPGSVRKEDDGPSRQQVARDEAQLASRYKRLEEMFLRLAELNGATDPGQADLLRKAMVESKQRLIAVQFEQIVERLERDSLGDAVSAQKRLRVDLKALLELLLSDVRADRLNEEQERVSAWLKQLDELISRQQSLRGRTERADDTQQLADDQGRLADQTGKLGESMAEQERDATKPVKKTPADGESSKESPPGESSDGQEDANAEPTQRDDAESSESPESSESSEADKSSSSSETEKSPEGESGGSSESRNSNDPSQPSQQEGGSASGSGQQSPATHASGPRAA